MRNREAIRGKVPNFERDLFQALFKKKCFYIIWKEVIVEEDRNIFDFWLKTTRLSSSWCNSVGLWGACNRVFLYTCRTEACESELSALEDGYSFPGTAVCCLTDHSHKPLCALWVFNSHVYLRVHWCACLWMRAHVCARTSEPGKKNGCWCVLSSLFNHRWWTVLQTVQTPDFIQQPDWGETPAAEVSFRAGEEDIRAW